MWVKIGKPVATGWQGKLARVSQMEWDELRVRAGQEFYKQRDLLMHRIEMPVDIFDIATDIKIEGQIFVAEKSKTMPADFIRLA